MAKKKEPSEPIQINAPYAYVSAMNALYVAQKFALENKDRNALIDIANSYIEMGSKLLEFGVELVYDEDESSVEGTEEKPTIGFAGGSVDREEEVEPTEEPPEDRGSVGF